MGPPQSGQRLLAFIEMGRGMSMTAEMKITSEVSNRTPRSCKIAVRNDEESDAAGLLRYGIRAGG